MTTTSSEPRLPGLLQGVRRWLSGPCSELFDALDAGTGAGLHLQDITYHRAVDQGTVRIAFNRPEVRNAFRPQTVDELYRALDHARDDAPTSAACC